MKMWKKWVLRLFLGLFLLFGAFMILAPGMIHRYIERNDLELIGRQIQMKDLDIKWFRAQVEIEGFDLREKDSTQSFITLDRLFLDINLWSLSRRFIHITTLSIDRPQIHVEQKGTQFNFDDLLELTSADSSKANEEQSQGKAWHFALDEYTLTDGFVLYQNTL